MEEHCVPTRNWEVVFDDAFKIEFDAFARNVQDKILARAILLETLGPNLPRPYADTLAGSKFGNMRELRAPVGKEVWRVAYAFDPRRRAVLLCAGNKEGTNQKAFYRDLIATADARFAKYK
jgi:hypothetical protein